MMDKNISFGQRLTQIEQHRIGVILVAMKHQQFALDGRAKKVARRAIPIAMRQKSDQDAELIVTAIKQSIAEGRLIMGGRVPPEVDLCKRYSASRHTVRKAMTLLEREGLVARFVGRGSFIVDPKLQSHAESIQPRTWSLHELTEARMAIEPHLASLMVERHTPAELAELEKLLETLARSSTWTAFGEAKYRFHLALVRTAKNSFLTHVFEELMESRRETGWYRHDPSGAVIDRVKDVTIQECRAILAALRNKDSKATRKEIENSIVRVLMWINGA